MTKKTTDAKPYRPCVGICLMNSKGKVFAGRRFGFAANSWQMPQGGVDKGEELEAAAFRELHEETGVTSAKIIKRTDDWLHYDLPPDLEKRMWKGKYAGQKQVWFLFQFEGDEREIDISGLGGEKAEFSDWTWMSIDEIVKQIVPFKRDIYKAVAKEFGEHLV